MQVIGIAGPARVGKSYATNALKDLAEGLGYTVEIIPFAKPLKDEAASMGFDKDTNPEEYRQFCQDEGSKMRAVNPDHWLNAWEKLVVATRDAHFANDKCPNPLLILADDVRYDNERDLITNSKGITVFLHSGDRVLEDASASWRTHESEMLANTLVGDLDRAAELFDYVTLNNAKELEMQAWAKTLLMNDVFFPGTKAQQCGCEGCNAALGNRPVDKDQVMDDLDNWLNKMEDNDDDS